MSTSSDPMLVGIEVAVPARKPKTLLKAGVGFLCGVACTSIVFMLLSKSSHRGSFGSAINMDEGWCTAEDFRETTLKTVIDATMFGLLPDIAKEKKFEMSGVVNMEHGFYGICDSSWSISVFHDLSSAGSFHTVYDPSKPPGDHWQSHQVNYLAAPADEEAFPHSVDSQFEAITYHLTHHKFITVQESVNEPFADGKYRAVFMEVTIDNHPKPVWHLDRACPSEFTFADDSKGFEGALGMMGVGDRFFILGLCEGNHCGTGKVGKEKGNGRIVIMEFDAGEGEPNTFEHGILKHTSTCQWKTVKIVDIPAVADFEDYSDVARRGTAIAITSQASSMLLLGQMTLTEDGLLDPETFAISEPEVRRFAPTPDCQVQYCNVEAIDFINDRLLVGGSDAMKGGGRQEYQCLEKDQSMHVFTLPAHTKIK